MAHFAKLDENNNVIAVHIVVNDVLMVNGIESENKGVEFLRGLTGHNDWVQTSYNANFRKHYAGIGYQYDKDFDVFISPKPYPSWKLNYTSFIWEAPVPMPEEINGYFWKWSEINKEWIQVEIPTV
jgi:hypothetical protein